MGFGFGTDPVSDELDMAKTFVNRLVEQVEQTPAKGARFTMAGEFHREQTANGTTGLEQGAMQSRWGS